MTAEKFFDLESPMADKMMKVVWFDMIFSFVVGMPVALIFQTEWALLTLLPLAPIMVWVVACMCYDVATMP